MKWDIEHLLAFTKVTNEYWELLMTSLGSLIQES